MERTKPNRITEAKQYAASEFAKRDTSIEGYRKECLTYVRAMKAQFNLKPDIEMGLVSTITTKTPLEAWKALNSIWLTNTTSVKNDGVKKILYEEIQKASDKRDMLTVFSHLVEVHLESNPIIDFKSSKIGWVRDAEPHYEILKGLAMVRPRKYDSDHILVEQEWWFINQVLLRDWYSRVGIKIEEERKRKEAEPEIRKDDSPPLEPMNAPPFM